MQPVIPANTLEIPSPIFFSIERSGPRPAKRGNSKLTQTYSTYTRDNQRSISLNRMQSTSSSVVKTAEVQHNK